MSDSTQLKHVVKSHFTTEDAVKQWEHVYSTSTDFFSYAMSARKQAVLDLMGGMKADGGNLVADIGCGSGLVSKGLLEMGYEVTGMDISEAMLENARKIPGLKLVVGDIENLPFADASFDKIICLGVITYLPDERKALAELHRILKPGGLLILAVRNKLEASVLLDPLGIAAKLYRKFFKKSVAPGGSNTARAYYHRNFIPWSLNKTLRSAGFKVSQRLGRGFDYPGICEKRLTTVRAGIRFSQRIEKLSGLPPFRFLRNWGLVYLAVAVRRDDN